MLIPDKIEKEETQVAKRFGVFAATLITFFLAMPASIQIPEFGEISEFSEFSEISAATIAYGRLTSAKSAKKSPAATPPPAGTPAAVRQAPRRRVSRAFR